MTCIIWQDDLRLVEYQPRAAEHYSGLGDDPSGHETKFAKDPSRHETKFVEDPLEVSRRWQTRKSHYVAPPPVLTDPESRPIIKPVGER
jgi:hypothetical protein